MPKNINGTKYRNAPASVARSVLAAEHDTTPAGCWLWRGPVTHDGYGFTRYRAGGKRWQVYIHRLVYLAVAGDPGDDAEIDHRCHDPRACRVPAAECPHRRCFNPAHLEAVTGAQNVLRSGSHPAELAARTACKRGHPFDAANTYRYPGGKRGCRRCHREDQAARRAASGATRSCARCGADIAARSGQAMYCEACNPPTWRGSRQRTAAKRAAGRACACCGADITGRRGNARYCAECGESRKRYGGHYSQHTRCPMHTMQKGGNR